MSDTKTIGLVGHCGADSFMLERTVTQAIPGCRVVQVGTDDALFDDSIDLLLVNRVLDGRFSADDGVMLIGQVADENGPPAMLISNFDDAQSNAHAAGALPGFGKAEAHTPKANDRLREALGLTTTA